MTTRATIRSIQDLMRQDPGVDGDAQRIAQLAWLLFLRAVDAQTEAPGGVQYPIPPGLRWRDWAHENQDLTGDALITFIDERLFPTLRTLGDETASPQAALVRNVFSDTHNRMKSGALLRQVVDRIDQFDLATQQDRHLFNDIYEQLLAGLQSAGDAGEFYTPRAVTQFMVDQVNPQPNRLILDPACGTGGFIVCALEHLRARGIAPAPAGASIRGIEKKPLPHLLGVANLLLHGVPVPLIERGNALEPAILSVITPNSVDYIFTNPPFGGLEEPAISAAFPTDLRTRDSANLFLLRVIDWLKPGGQAAIILPDGLLFSEGVHTRIKQLLLQTCDLHTIVRLSPGVFAPYTDIPTNLLFFTKGNSTQNIWCYEHPLPRGYVQYAKKRPIRLEEFALEKAWWNHRTEGPQAWCVPIDAVIATGYNLDLKNPHRPSTPSEDPAELLTRYRELETEIEQLRRTLAAELGEMLGDGDTQSRARE